MEWSSYVIAGLAIVGLLRWMGEWAASIPVEWDE